MRLLLVPAPPLLLAASLVLPSGCIAASHRGSTALTPAKVGQMLERYGAKRTVDILAKAGSDRRGLGDYDKVLSGIASGNARWLALVPRLEPGTDAATGETLTVAVAQALPKNPAGVLRLIATKPSWASACSYPMIEPTAKETRAYFRAAVPAVRSVHEPALQSARTRCLAALAKAQH